MHTRPTGADARPKIDFEALRRDEALLVQVVEQYVTGGQPLYRSGLRYRTRAGPEATSATLYLREDGVWRFHRFSTGENGDALDVLQWYGGAQTVAQAAAMVGALPPVPERIRRRATRPEEQPTPPRWTTDVHAAEALVRAYRAHPEALERWRAYKPLDAATLARCELGVGVLPRHEVVRSGERSVVYAGGCGHERLIYPVRRGGVVVALRGRHLGCSCDPKRTKWLSAGGSRAHLYNLEKVRRGCNLVVCENPVDAMLASMVEPDVVVAAPTAGAGTWKPEWTATLAAVRPHAVAVWYDHDLAGNGHAGHCGACDQELHEWRLAHPSAHRPPPGGRRVLEALRSEGLPLVRLHEWHPSDAHGRDLGDVLRTHLEAGEQAANEAT